MKNFSTHLPGFHGKDAMREKAKRMFSGSRMNASELKVRTSASAPSKSKQPRLYAKGGVVAEKTTTMASHLKKGRCYNDGGEVDKPVTARRGGKIKSHKRMPCLREEMEGTPIKRKGTTNPLKGPKTPRRVPVIKHGRKGKRRFDSGGMVMDEPVDAAMMRAQAPVAPAPAPSRMQQALGMARQYAPQAQGFLNKNAPRLGRAFGQARDFANRAAPVAQQALGVAKRYAPQAQDFISRFSPSLGKKFGSLRSMVGLKKGGRASEKYAMGGSGKVRHGQSTASGRPIVKKRGR
jgi:hypothetical protein